MFKSPEILLAVRDLNGLFHDPLDYTPWRHASTTQNKRVSTVKMAVQYKKSALPNKYSPICRILWLTQKKKKKKLTKNV